MPSVVRFTRQLTAYFLLLSVVTTVIPFNLFLHHHHHEDHAHCDETNHVLESDPCHISIYHSRSEEHKCSHESHVTVADEDCQYCQFHITERAKYTANIHSAVVPLFVAENVLATKSSFRASHSFHSFLGRAPPAC